MLTSASEQLLALPLMEMPCLVENQGSVPVQLQTSSDIWLRLLRTFVAVQGTACILLLVGLMS